MGSEVMIGSFSNDWEMIPVGYMAKHVSARKDWLDSDRVTDIFSVSGCVSSDFTDFVRFWKHNEYCFFDSPQIIRDVAAENLIALDGTSLFYYEQYGFEFDDEVNTWRSILPVAAETGKVTEPLVKCFEGVDVVNICEGGPPDCSPLSCNGLAAEVSTNEHCLLTSVEQAKQLLEDGRFLNCEPGPYRIFAVYSVPWP